MIHRFLRFYPFILIINYHFRKEIECFFTDHMLILSVYKIRKWSLFKFLTLDQFFSFFWYLQCVSMNVFMKVVLAKNSHYPNQLIVIVAALKKGVNLEDHSRHGTAERPNI